MKAKDFIVAAAVLGVSSEFLVPMVNGFVAGFLPTSLVPAGSIRTSAASLSNIFSVAGIASILVSGSVLAGILSLMGKSGIETAVEVK